MRLGYPPFVPPIRRGRSRVASLAVAVMVGSLAIPVVTAPGVQAETQTLMNHTFEGGALHGWSGNGLTAVSTEVGAGVAHAGTAVMEVKDKTGGWAAAMRNLATDVQPGVTYTLSAYMRMAAGTGKVSMTLNAGTQYLFGDSWATYEVPLTATGWTQVTQTYTVPAGGVPTPMQVYFQKAEAEEFATFYVDDFTITYEEAAGGSGPEELLNSTFEDGTTELWGARGTATVANSTAQAHEGTHSLLTTGRAEAWNSPAINLTSEFQGGVEYTFSAWVRLESGTDQANMAIQQTLGGTNSWPWIGGRQDVTATGWTHLTGTWTAPTGATELTLYVESATVARNYYIDDILVTYQAGGSGGGDEQVNESFNHTFESGNAEGWGPRGSAVLANSTAQAHGGTHSLLTTGRSDTWNGPSFSLLGGVVPGVQYTLSAWVRMASGTDQLKMTIEQTVSGSTSWPSVGSVAQVDDTGWTNLTGTWTAPTGASALTLYVEGASATSSYYIDDIVMTYLGDEQTPPPPSLPDGLEEVTDFGNNPGNLKMFVHVPDQLANPAPILVVSHFCGGSATAMYGGYGAPYVQASDQHGFIIIFPQTQDPQCFDVHSNEALVRGGGSDPVSIRSMISHVQTNYTTDSNKIFATGVSSGAMMTNVLLANYPDVFAAGASFMGVAHSCFATGSLTNWWNSTCAEGNSSKTAQEWGDLARAAYPAFTGTYPRMQLWHGTIDSTISYNNLGEATKQWTNLHGLNHQTPSVTANLNGTWTRSRFGGTGTTTAKVESISVEGANHVLPQDGMQAYALAFFGLGTPAEEVPSEGPTVFGFEDGTTQGWVSRGGVESVVNTTEQAHGGTHSLRVTGRQQTWQGPVRNVLNTIVPGASYIVTAWLRAADGQTASARLSIESRIDGNPTYQGVTPLTAINDQGWVQVSGTYTLMSNVDFLKIYAEAEGLESFYLDDVEITPASATDPGKPPTPVEDPDPNEDDEEGILFKHGFEDGTTQNWKSRGGEEKITNSTAAAHEGTHSLLVSDRVQSWQSPILNLMGRVDEGVAYSVEAWVRMAAGEGESAARITIETRKDGTPRYEGLSELTPVNDQGWTKVRGSYTFVGGVDFIKLYVETEDTKSFHVDDVTMTYTKTLPIEMDIPSLKDEVAKFWPRTGAAVGVPQIMGDRAVLLKKHFNSITAENAMKWDQLHRTEGKWNFTEADQLVDFAQKNDMGVYGHTLAWHRQVPDWVFQDENGNDLPVNAESKQLVLDRLEDHIRVLVGRYKGKVYAWDVVNEVLANNEVPDPTDIGDYRNSKYYQYTGLDYIRTAFRVAHEADPNAQLCINDYNGTEPIKRQRYFNLVKMLLDEGLPVQCVGHQLHSTPDYPTTANLDTTLTKFATLGLPQRITELDVSVYIDGDESLPTIPVEYERAQQAQYQRLFEVLYKHSEDLASVSFWGLADDRTWLAEKRLNTPLLFDKQLQAKPAFHTVVDLARNWVDPEPIPPVQKITSRVTLKTKGNAAANVSLSGGWCLDMSEEPRVQAIRQNTGVAKTLNAVVTQTPNGGYVARFAVPNTTPLGTYAVHLEGIDCDGKAYVPPSAESKLGSFRVVSPTAVTMNASPEPVAKGRAITVKGVLKRLVSGEVKGWRGATVQVEFRPANAKSYTPVKTLTTGSGGAFVYQAKASRDGAWRVRFAGSTYHVASSKADYVDVR